MDLYGTWIKYDAHNCPLPSDAFIDGLAASQDGLIWATVHRQETVIDDNRRTERGWMDGILQFDHDNWTWIPWGRTRLPQVMFQRRVVCDSAGNLWLSSAKSVCRYDGQTTELFNGGENGLPDGPVFPCKLTPGRDNSMWLAMRLRGIYFFNDKGWQKFTID
ncbi:MAG TPA: hypothetical protein VMP08_12720, partial [Anaerolineae bacterium]|nr:hypothetical protein [Anaerolineae bacterium]